MSASAQWQDRVVPAQLSFLAIYNPTLGPTDETFADQLVFWYSRAANETRASHRRANASSKGKAKSREDELREEENERLRQIGLAQGMVDFARTFSNGKSVDSVETEKSRIVLKELEPGWWILASIDLTKLPSSTPAQPLKSTKGGVTDTNTSGAEYSSREVSPPALLIEQLVQAHCVYLLHHGASLDELFVKLPRDRFCSTLARYWARFARSWDVLLHGNPAADVFSGLKLASGGELGFGVGEEEWGSGEREVLEDLVHRTEGLVDLVVARYGEPAPKDTSTRSSVPEAEALPWMGCGSRPSASDGIFFSGVNAVNRTSLRDISLWMQQIYAHGEFAYGVQDNPNRERRKRRRRNPPESNVSPSRSGAGDGSDATELRKDVIGREAAKKEVPATIDPDLLPKDHRPQVHDRVASHDHATNETLPQVASHPGIPPPIVSAAEQALDKATKRAASRSRPEKVEETDSGTTMGIPDQYMHVMTFGLSYLAKSYTKKQPETRRPSDKSDETLKPPARSLRSQNEDVSANEEDDLTMSQIDPIPDGAALQAKLAQQIHLENTGSFVIGLKGDLDREANSEDNGRAKDDVHDSEDGSRMVLRTLHVDMVTELQTYSEEVDESFHVKDDSRKGKSTDSTMKNVKRLQVLVYVHRPFMYCFLFEQRTPSLSYSSFYKTLHHNLVPIHKPLLSSTSYEKVAQRIESSHIEASDTASQTSASSNRLPFKLAETTPIFDLLYDPARLTVHTSIPNIPDPGTPAAEGIVTSTNRSSSAPWTRIEALNVHSQILNTLASTATQRNELERTSKTTRGWWIVWMRLPPSSDTTSANGDDAETARKVSDSASTDHVPGDSAESPPSTTGHATTLAPPPADLRRVAFLVRKANDPSTQAKASTGSRMASGMWSSLALRSNPMSEDKTGGASSGWGPAALTGGIGVDARKYVEGLLSLNR